MSICNTCEDYDSTPIQLYKCIWAVPVDELPEICSDDCEHPSRKHAYILPDDTVWILNHEGSGWKELTGGGGGEDNIIEIVQQNGVDLPVVNKTVNVDLTNYYTKDETYNQSDIDNHIATVLTDSKVYTDEKIQELEDIYSFKLYRHCIGCKFTLDNVSGVTSPVEIQFEVINTNEILYMANPKPATFITQLRNALYAGANDEEFRFSITGGCKYENAGGSIGGAIVVGCSFNPNGNAMSLNLVTLEDYDIVIPFTSDAITEINDAKEHILPIL